MNLKRDISGKNDSKDPELNCYFKTCLNVDFRQSGGCRSDCSGSGILILVVGGHAVARNDVAEADRAKQIGKVVSLQNIYLVLMAMRIFFPAHLIVKHSKVYLLVNVFCILSFI
jgi:hypothetical protein